MKLHRHIAMLYAIAALVVSGWIIFAADSGALPPFVTKLYAFPNGDKAGHFLLMGALTIGVNLLLSARTVSIFSTSILLGSLLVFVGATVEEISQMVFQTRTFSLLDLGFSYMGILVADLGIRYMLAPGSTVAD